MGNTAGGVNLSEGCSATLLNCILWGNPGTQTIGSAFSIRYSDIQGGWGGQDGEESQRRSPFRRPGAERLPLGKSDFPGGAKIVHDFVTPFTTGAPQDRVEFRIHTSGTVGIIRHSIAAE